MDIDKLTTVIASIPHMIPERGREIYDFVREREPKSVLELGFAHGVSSCYIGAALKANGRGTLTTIDLESARQRQPDISTLLAQTGLQDWVRPIHTPTSYTWELMRLLDDGANNEQPFDFAFIDGAHSWFVDGFAFFLVDRLLKPGGWILFDDLDWTYSTSRTMHDTEMVKAMPADERTTAQVGKVFDLLIRTHPQYEQFRVDGSWGWARKKGQ